jgi:hypothetical protein
MRHILHLLRKQKLLLDRAIRALEDFQALGTEPNPTHQGTRARGRGAAVPAHNHPSPPSRKGEVIHIRKRLGG